MICTQVDPSFSHQYCRQIERRTLRDNADPSISSRFRIMTALPQHLTTPAVTAAATVDHHHHHHHHFDWSNAKQQQMHRFPNAHSHLHDHPVMTHTDYSSRQYVQQKRFVDDDQVKQNSQAKESIPSSSHEKFDPRRKKAKLNGIHRAPPSHTDDLNQSQRQVSSIPSRRCLRPTALTTLSLQRCYPFQAELTQKIDIECASSQIVHTPTHHFTLSTVINLSVNDQTTQQQQQQQALELVPSSSQDRCARGPTDPDEFLVTRSSPSNISNLLCSVPLIPYSELHLTSYLRDLDLSTFDTFALPACPNAEDYLTSDGLVAFLSSDHRLFKDKAMEWNKSSRQHSHDRTRMQQISNYPRTPHSTHYPMSHSSSLHASNHQVYQNDFSRTSFVSLCLI